MTGISPDRQRDIRMTNTESKCKYKKCDGTGWLLKRQADGRELSFRCKCLEEEIRQHRFDTLLKESQIDDLRHMTFESYKPQHPTQKLAHEQL